MKRHNEDEITSKLRQAGELIARGQTQSQICKALGISVMTLHRWRKLAPIPPRKAETANDIYKAESLLPSSLNERDPISEKEILLENRRLKRIITDLLLEKIKLEELLEARVKSRN